MYKTISFNPLLLVVIILTFFVIPPGADAAYNNSPSYLKIEQTSDFEFSGKGESLEWEKAEWVVITQRNNFEIDYTTKVRILYSKTGIYFLFHCGDRIINSTMQADNLKLWQEDVVEVFLMPDEKYPIYFEYQLSPLNYELTILVPNIGGNFLGWLPWQYEGDRKTRRNTSVIRSSNAGQEEISGWMAEFFIPWKLLEPLVIEPPQKGDRWKANMYRLDYDHGITRFSWQKTVRNFHEPENFGTFIFN